MENIEPIQFQFVGIQILTKSLEKMPEGGLTHDFHFDLKFDTKVNADLKLVMPIVTITVSQRGFRLGAITVACLFEIMDFENRIVKNDQNLYIIPPQLDQIIRPVAISTTRGVMYSEFRGTHLNNAILPVVFMNQMKELPKDESREQYTILKDAQSTMVNL